MNDNKDFKIGQIRGKAGLVESWLKDILLTIDFGDKELEPEIEETLKLALKEVQEIKELSKQI